MSVTQLRGADLEALLAFLNDVSRIEFAQPYPRQFLVRLQGLVPCDAVTYQELDLRAKRVRAMVATDADEDDDEDLYWSVGRCPISEYRVRTGDLAAVRMSDVIDGPRYHELAIFRDYFHPVSVEHLLDVGLPAAPYRHRSLVFFRRLGATDFSERDRAILDMLRPHLFTIEATAALRRRLATEPPAPGGDGDASVYSDLTAREREIVELVAEGKTNAQIGEQLWIAPSTVKKHLEHVYEKLGVRRRAAAVSALASFRYPGGSRAHN